MCHLILFLPVFALPLFWVLPFGTALPLYLFILAISFFLYFKVFQAMHQGVQTGQEAMLKKKALVIEDINPEGKVQYAGEIWDAKGEGKRFLKGEHVLIKEFSGLNLIVSEIAFEKDTIKNASTLREKSAGTFFRWYGQLIKRKGYYRDTSCSSASKNIPNKKTAV